MSSNNQNIIENNSVNVVDIEIGRDEIVAISSSSSNEDNNELKMDELKMDHLPKSSQKEEYLMRKGRKQSSTISLKSLQSDGSMYGHSHEYQSDLLDALRVLSISLQQELDIIVEYFPGLQYHPYESNILFEKSSVQTIEIKYQITNESIPEHLLSLHQVQLILNILNTYPKEVRTHKKNK